MNKEELFEALGIDRGEDFEYFDNMADLLEMEEYFDEKTLYLLLEDADMNILKGLFETYFDDIITFLPDYDTELNGLLEMIKLSFMGICSGGENAQTYDKLSEEIIKFRDWYVFSDKVKHNDNYLSVRDAITNCRFSKLSGGEDDFDFTDALEYDIDEYSISIEDMEEYEEFEE